MIKDNDITGEIVWFERRFFAVKDLFHHNRQIGHNRSTKYDLQSSIFFLADFSVKLDSIDWFLFGITQRFTEKKTRQLANSPARQIKRLTKFDRYNLKVPNAYPPTGLLPDLFHSMFIFPEITGTLDLIPFGRFLVVYSTKNSEKQQ